jgi:HK97 family phage prohead protease
MGKTLDLVASFKFDDEPLGEFTGYANVSSVVDRQSDRVMKGAFAKDLATNGPRRVLQWQHDASEPIGTVELAEDDHGLRVVRGKLVLEVQRAKEAYALLKAGAITSMSIGYDVVDSRFDRKGVRELVALRVHEVSLVTHAANLQAVVDHVKAGGEAELKSLLDTLQSLNRSARDRREAEQIEELTRAIRNARTAFSK